MHGPTHYTIVDISQLSESVPAGLKYTSLYDMSSTYTRSAGEYTITGYMDIWGPCMGMEIIAPFGNPSQTPSLNVSPGEKFAKQGGTR
jgi:hypothetical protein